MKFALIVGLMASLGACSPTAPAPIEIAHKAVAARMLDPASAMFRSDVVVGDKVCGLVSGHNGFGGYGQPVRFIATVVGDQAYPVIEPDNADHDDPNSQMSYLWSKECVLGAAGG